MLSPSKILLTVAIIAGVVLATRFLRRRNDAKVGRGRAEPPPADDTLSLEACPVCGDYVDGAAPACARADCPRA